MNSFKKINIKNGTYYVFEDMIKIKNLDPSKIKIDENSNKFIFYLFIYLLFISFLIYHMKYVTIKDLSYVKINRVNPSYLIINKINGYIEESNRNKCLTLVRTNESKDTLKAYEELWHKIRNFIRSIVNNRDNMRNIWN